MLKPIEPSKEDCCNSGCNPCIFDIYEKQLKLYEKCLVNGENNVNISEENGILQLEYTKFVVVKSVEICNLHKHIFFKRLPLYGKKVWWNPGHHFLLKYTSLKEAYTRAYTPLIIGNEPQRNYDFSIVVKKYEDGAVSTHLFNLSEGCVTLWRGPYGHYEMLPNKFDRIIMIAQGTGIAPFITIMNKILNNEDDMTKIVLLFCCKCSNTIIFRDLFYNFKSYWNFKYEIYVNTEIDRSKLRYQEPIVQQKLNTEDIDKFKPYSIKDQILICGSHQFNENYEEYIKKKYPLVENIVLF